MMDQRAPHDPATDVQFRWQEYSLGVTMTKEAWDEHLAALERPHKRRRSRSLLWLAVALWSALMLLAIVGAFAAPALAHEATNIQGSPQGWTYEGKCCSNQDCGPAHFSEVELLPNGWRIRVEGANNLSGKLVEEDIPFGDPRLRKSPDGEFHVCINSSGKVLCVYIGGMAG